MSKDPWTDPDPQPGDFDAEIDAMDPHERGKGVREVLVELVRDA